MEKQDQEPFIIENGKFKCPKCGSFDYHVWAGMFVDRFTCKNCGYVTHM